MTPFSGSSFSSSFSYLFSSLSLSESSSSSSSSTLAKPTLSPEQLRQRIYDTLTDKRNDDETVANLLFNAYSNGVTEPVYEVVNFVAKREGADAIKISDGIKEILAKRGLTLLQHKNGTIMMHREVIVTLDDDKGATGTKAGRIEFSQRNEGAIAQALRYGSAEFKATIIRQAVERGQEAFLNQLVPRFFLSGVNLSGLDLRRLNLDQAVLANAILSKTNLADVDLSHANLNDANLDGANLNGAVLFQASFCHGSARSTSFNKANLNELCADGTDFSGAGFTGANCRYTRFVAATLTEADMRRSVALDDAHLHGATTTDTAFPTGFVIQPLPVTIEKTTETHPSTSQES